MTEALEITAGGLTAIVQNNNYQGSCAGNGCASIYYGGTDEGMAVIGSIDGWQFEVLDTGPSLVATALTCVGDGCTSDPLHVIFSDIDFTDTNALFFDSGAGLACNPGPLYVPGYHGQTPPFSFNCGGGIPGASSASAYYDAGNRLFAETTPIVGVASPSSTPYSLTVDEEFEANSHGGTVTSEGATLTTPEPVSIALLGTVLALLARRTGAAMPPAR